jgi:signal transduction histidine kinase
VLLHDISDYKELEAVARQREALARVGEMIAAINHEIGNILQPVQSQILRLAAHQDPGVARAVEIVQDRLSALNGMLANLKDLSRPIELRCRMLDLGNLTRSVVRDVQEMPVAADVQFNIQVQPQRLNCNADGHWLRQVLYNLIRNAAEATVGRTERKVRVNAAVTDSFVRIEIQDTGCGIDPRVRGKLFQPFFSTKGKAGTGLGLSICRRVVELHGGRIEVADQPGEGARFFVFLPLSASAQATCS